MQYNNDDFLKKITNYCLSAYNDSKIHLTKFLSSYDQEVVKTIAKKYQVNAYFYGGYEQSEYKRALITNFDYEKSDFKVVIFKIKYPKKYLTLSHRIVLGTLLSLGITRESIGDIICEDECFLIVCKEIAKYIKEEFNTINRHYITLEEVFNPNIEVKDEYLYSDIICSSLRLDAILAKAYNLSRNQAFEVIKNKMVKLNGILCDNPSANLKESDLLSVMKKGRLKIVQIKGHTKQNNLVIEVGKLR